MEFLAGRVRPVAEDFCRRPNPRPLDGLLRDPGAAPVLPLQGWRLGDRLTREGVSGVVCHAQAVLRHHHGVELRPGLTIENSFLDTFAQRSGISRLALYGSVLRDDFGPSSDVDMLVEFLPARTPGFLRLAQMEFELEPAIGRKVELRTYGDLSPYFRDDVSATAPPGGQSA